MKRMIKWIIIIVWSVVGILGICIIFTLAGLYKTHVYQRDYLKVECKDSESKVINLLGSPSEVTSGGKYISWDYDTTIYLDTSKVLKKEFWYYSPVPYISPEKWSIGFDNENKVISKYHYVSP
jgi:hypothetical protein